MPTVVSDAGTGLTREQLQAALVGENIDARVFFWPLSSLPSFEAALANIHAYQIPTRAINLPSYHDISENDLGRVVDTLSSLCVKVGLGT
jgi:perosamine synthetase